MNKKSLSLFAAGVAGLSTSLFADTIPYTDIGTLNSAVYNFTATANGPVVAYFFGSSASYGSDIGLFVNNLSQGIYGLENHMSSYGDLLQISLGNVNIGDVLQFQLRVQTGGGDPASGSSYSLSSTPSLNSDGLQHIYSTAWAGDSTIPAGTYVGFEDILGGGDKDYNDEQFVFVNVGTSTPYVGPTVPDGGMTISMLGMAFAGLGLLRRKVQI